MNLAQQHHVLLTNYLPDKCPNLTYAADLLELHRANPTTPLCLLMTEIRVEIWLLVQMHFL